MPKRDLARFNGLLNQSILEARLLIRLSLDEQSFWRDGSIHEALSILRFKKEVVSSFNILDEKRRALQAELPAVLDDSDERGKECRSSLETLRGLGAYLHLINQNTISLAGRALQHDRRRP